MDPADDMYDPYDFDFIDNSDGTPAEADDDGAGDEFDNSVVDDSLEEESFTVLKEDDIRQRQEDDITRISTLLSIPRDSACILLHRYKWNSNRAQDQWLADEGRVRKDVGLFAIDLPVVRSPKRQCKLFGLKLDKSLSSCGICFETYGCDRIKTAGCGHPFCTECWGAYISSSINDGPGCLTLKCPTPSCGAAVGIDMVDKLVSSDNDKDKYRQYLFRSYIEDNYKKPKWCPGPGCECVVEYDVGSRKNYDVTCICSYSFCWNCREEAHRPVDCDTVAKWVLKNSSESKNMDWILANSKPCPKCKRAIEKNHGCMHMTCTAPCKFEFCWVCLRDWKIHGYNYNCNRYNSAERTMKQARQYIIRYTHYYERWAANHSSRQKALADLHRMQTDIVQDLGSKHGMNRAQFEFVVEAWQQIVECRRVLKWTYAYGYYIPEQEYAKRNLFEYLQGQAEAGLERLHLCAEKELQPYLSDKSPGDFIDYRTRLLDLTKVTGNFFENLVRALENGFSEMGMCSTSTNSATKQPS